MIGLRNPSIFLSLLIAVAVTVSSADDDYDYSEEDKKPSCDPAICRLPDCRCFGSQPDIPLDQRPQFVMVTFDDAMTVANVETYKQIVRKGRFQKDVKITFFVCHEYNDYSITQSFYLQGHEIAVHTISHESNTDLWRHGTPERWKRETVGMRTMLSTYAGIPKEELGGHRAPFLQTAGDVTFEVLKKEGFFYDSSMPSRNYMDLPIWPYTLDFGYAQDCQIEPCPNGRFEGLWEIPMVQYHRSSTEGDFYCSMLDACTPQPKTASDTKDYLMKNFLRHYRSNKAPFPIFLHEAWLREKERLDGFMQFLDEILQKPDVFAATVRDVVEYVRNPVTYDRIRFRERPEPRSCKKIETCSYKEPLRIMRSCSPCPEFYPWVGTPLGKVPPRDFPN
ncbi:nodB homology domain-containing protein [Trichonephila clavipes]|nr:nodB homology domain-containing protein [Trichonephila clavipes]